MSMKKKYSKQTKFQAALKMIKGEETVSQIAQAYGTHAKVLHKWKKVLMEQGPEIFGQGVSTQSDQSDTIESLQRKVGQLTMELDFFKKALAP